MSAASIGVLERGQCRRTGRASPGPKPNDVPPIATRLPRERAARA